MPENSIICTITEQFLSLPKVDMAVSVLVKDTAIHKRTQWPQNRNITALYVWGCIFLSDSFCCSNMFCKSNTDLSWQFGSQIAKNGLEIITGRFGTKKISMASAFIADMTKDALIFSVHTVASQVVTRWHLWLWATAIPVEGQYTGQNHVICGAITQSGGGILR